MTNCAFNKYLSQSFFTVTLHFHPSSLSYFISFFFLQLIDALTVIRMRSVSKDIVSAKLVSMAQDTLVTAKDQKNVSVANYQ